jgi:hypothetical protein
LASLSIMCLPIERARGGSAGCPRTAVHGTELLAGTPAGQDARVNFRLARQRSGEGSSGRRRLPAIRLKIAQGWVGQRRGTVYRRSLEGGRPGLHSAPSCPAQHFHDIASEQQRPSLPQSAPCRPPSARNRPQADRVLSLPHSTKPGRRGHERAPQACRHPGRRRSGLQPADGAA